MFTFFLQYILAIVTNCSETR